MPYAGIPISQKGVPEGVAALDANGRVPAENLPELGAVTLKAAGHATASNDTTTLATFAPGELSQDDVILIHAAWDTNHESHSSTVDMDFGNGVVGAVLLNDGAGSLLGVNGVIKSTPTQVVSSHWSVIATNQDMIDGASISDGFSILLASSQDPGEAPVSLRYSIAVLKGGA